MADGNILRWLANLEKHDNLLKQYEQYYVGHGATCTYETLQEQRNYFNTYCGEILKHTKGSGIFSDDTKEAFVKSMLEKYPDYGCQFMVGLAAEVVANELK